MVGYELHCWRDPKGYELIGVVPERRNNPQRITKEITNYLFDKSKISLDNSCRGSLDKAKPSVR